MPLKPKAEGKRRMSDEKEPRAGTDAGHSRETRRYRDKHTLRLQCRNTTAILTKTVAHVRPAGEAE